MIQNHAYLIRRNGIFYFSRRVPADVRARFNKDRVIVSLHTRSLPEGAAIGCPIGQAGAILGQHPPGGLPHKGAWAFIGAGG